MDQKLVERIRKMHAKAEGAKDLGNEAEALAFASAVQKLLLKHNLEMSDVEALAEEQADPIKAHFYDPRVFGLKGSKVKVFWTLALAKIVAQAHMCETIPVAKSNQVMLVGTRQNRSLAELMIVTLTRYCLEHSEKDYVKFFYECRDRGDVTRARGYKAGWLLGFVSRLRQRYEEDRAALRAEVSFAGNKHALIRLDKQLVKVHETLEKITSGPAFKKARQPGGRAASAEGIEDGAGHADRVNLRGTGISKADRQKGLGPGQGLLGSGG